MKYVILLVSTAVVWIGAAIWLVLAPEDDEGPAALPVVDVAPLGAEPLPVAR